MAEKSNTWKLALGLSFGAVAVIGTFEVGKFLILDEWSAENFTRTHINGVKIGHTADCNNFTQQIADIYQEQGAQAAFDKVVRDGGRLDGKKYEISYRILSPEVEEMAKWIEEEGTEKQISYIPKYDKCMSVLPT